MTHKRNILAAYLVYILYSSLYFNLGDTGYKKRKQSKGYRTKKNKPCLYESLAHDRDDVTLMMLLRLLITSIGRDELELSMNN